MIPFVVPAAWHEEKAQLFRKMGATSFRNDTGPEGELPSSLLLQAVEMMDKANGKQIKNDDGFGMGVILPRVWVYTMAFS
ncbi:hypothetical protein LVJ94_15800 [Pendulispora rubella]|uniref:Uncharacterized protein n=1 Tax=Pendulispora rubella TaxID=2741070 RepID=A0ABZ2LCN9_9BACT